MGPKVTIRDPPIARRTADLPACIFSFGVPRRGSGCPPSQIPRKSPRAQPVRPFPPKRTKMPHFPDKTPDCSPPGHPTPIIFGIGRLRHTILPLATLQKNSAHLPHWAIPASAQKSKPEISFSANSDWSCSKISEHFPI